VTILTAAVKNMFGTVTGLYKAECHSRSPKDEDFAKVIAKVYSISKPRLTVLDGIVAMEGDGPSAGEPRRMNVVMAGADAVAIDACVAGVIGLKPADIAITKEAHAAGLGEADMSEIEVAGDDISTFAVKDFKLPQTTPLRLLPRPVIESLAGLVRFKPQIDEAACRRCNLCKTSCAVGAITIGKDSCAIDYDRCVRCMCCHEVCPYKAIHIRRNILTRWIWG
jgi:Pyruvate/2-oxoacid:ferredoxin oxidoreductase delta subunit